jgi:hypothetical protein
MHVFAYVGEEEERETTGNPINTCSAFQPRIQDVLVHGPKIHGTDGVGSIRMRELRLREGERRGYWMTQQGVVRPIRQVSIRANINDREASVLLDTGAEASILSSSFARKLGVKIDTSKKLRCVGIGDDMYRTEGRATVKITIGGHLVYEYTMWVGQLRDQEAILGMDFMVPAGVRLDLADGSACMPDEVRIR